MSNRNWSVEQLVNYIKNRLENDSVLTSLSVKGEISNFIAHTSGHFYFTLKDEHAAIPCVMFSTYARKVSFRVKEGAKVVVTARVSLYEKSGKLQLYVSDMKEDGLGDLYQRLEFLKQKLLKEGLFAAEHKKPLPAYPFEIAVISGKDTAANSDVHTTLKRRWPVARVIDYYSLVQGDAAVNNIVEQLKKADSNHHDVIILARGGGSLEDLWCFNEEAVVRTIYACNTPVITGIGHEVDYTLSDFAADVRANTPTGAAELVSPKLSDVEMQILRNRNRMEELLMTKMGVMRQSLDQRISHDLPKISESIVQKPSLHLMMTLQQLSRFPAEMKEKHAYELFTKKAYFYQYPHKIEEKRHENALLRQSLYHHGKGLLQTEEYHLKDNCARIKKAEEERIRGKQNSLDKMAGLLNVLSPFNILKRGYAVVEHDGKILKDSSDVEVSDRIDIRFSDGKISAVVSGKE